MRKERRCYEDYAGNGKSIKRGMFHMIDQKSSTMKIQNSMIMSSTAVYASEDRKPQQNGSQSQVWDDQYRS